MVYLLISIVSSSMLVILFKVFERYNIDLFPAIVFNYLAAATVGYLFDDSGLKPIQVIHQEWIFMALFFGVFFISLFNLIGISTQKSGISITTVANKMSVALPVLSGVLVFGESVKILQILGILLALISVYLVCRPSEKQTSQGYVRFLLPVVIFFGSGILDSLINFALVHYRLESSMSLFFSVSFGCAGFIGLFPLLFKITRKKYRPQIRTIIMGIVLGVINFFSLYGLMQALHTGNFPSTIVFPLNNMGIVLLSAIAATLFFQEKLSVANRVGIVISLVAILLIMN